MNIYHLKLAPSIYISLIINMKLTLMKIVLYLEINLLGNESIELEMTEGTWDELTSSLRRSWWCWFCWIFLFETLQMP